MQIREIRRYVDPGETVSMELAHSEVCMYMQVAGKRMDVRLQGEGWRASAQILTASGGDFSIPILPGEAGFYFDRETGRHYFYTPIAAVATVAA
jgi:hypothetical protein